MSNPIQYDELSVVARNGDGLFFQGGSWKSHLIRWWTNDESSWWRRWIALAPYQHAEIVVWDSVVSKHEHDDGDDPLWTIQKNGVRLCSWGSVDGGPRKTPLKRLVQSYNRRGGKVFWAPLMATSDCRRYWMVGVPRVECSSSEMAEYRQQVIERANAQWGCHYPNLRQWWRTGLRNWYKDNNDTDPEGTTCYEFVARNWGLPDPTTWFGKELAECGLVETPREIVF